MSKKAIFDKKNILITGGAGFIGSHLCDELVKTSKVICIDNFSTGQEKNIDHLLANPDFEFIRHDISKPINLLELSELQKFKIEFQGVQEIYHLACPMSPKDFEKNKIETVISNSHGTKNALDMAVKYNAKFLHYSSSVVYGVFNSISEKVDESFVGKIDNLSDRAVYDEGKRFAETLVMNYEKEYGVDAKILRIFRTYGPRMKLNDNQMIPDFINNALDDKDIMIYGDKNFSSSFCFVSDIVDVSIKAANTKLSGPVNLGSDVRVNLTSIAEKIINMVNSKSQIKYTDQILFMKPLCLPDITKAKNELGWLPIVTIDKGLEKAIYDLRANKGVVNII